MTRDVFISHAGDDASVAGEVCALLEKRGLKCWMAPRDVAAGSEWDEAILDAIETSRVFLLILSKSANDSAYVKNEVNRAFSERKPIVTFRIEDVMPGRSLQLYLARHHWTDAFPPPLAARVEALATSIMALRDPSVKMGTAPIVVPPIRTRLVSCLLSPLRTIANEVRAFGRRKVLVTLGLLVIVSIVASFAAWNFKSVPSPKAIYLNAELGADATLYVNFGPSANFSPDGTRLAFVAIGLDQKRHIYIRPLNQLQTGVLAGTDNARDIFFSPDSQWIGFFADGMLKKISVQGGAAVTVCDAINDRGGSWGDDGTIVFAPNNSAPLSKVNMAGGTPEQLTKFDSQATELTHRWPQVLPGSKAVLFTSNTHLNDHEDAEITLYSMAAGTRKTLVRGGFYARYLPTGDIIYIHEGTLFAIPFDLNRLEITGQPTPILDGVVSNAGNAGAQFSFSDGGNLVYAAGKRIPGISIFWMDQEGKFSPLRSVAGVYNNLAFSPDGKRLAFDLREAGRNDVWVYELERDALTRLTFVGIENTKPIWTPDGQRIVYSSQEKGGATNLWWIRADGAGVPQRISESANAQFAGSWRRDGKVLAYVQLNSNNNWDIMTIPFEGDEKTGWKPGEPKLFFRGTSNVFGPAFSPDGRWLSYHSNESGNYEVYVRPYSAPGVKWQVSSGGGILPKWSPNGKELFYRTLDDKIMVVRYTGPADTFRADNPKPWSPGQFAELGPSNFNFDLFPDGKRFAVLKSQFTEKDAAASKITVVLNWFEELKQKVPAGKN